MPRTALLGAALLAASPALAEPTETQRAQVQALWLLAFGDWSPALTCGATLGESDALLRDIWTTQTQKALDAMQANGWPQDQTDALRAKARPEAMRLPPDTSFADLIVYCDRHSDWLRKVNRLDLLNIDREVDKILTKATP